MSAITRSFFVATILASTLLTNLFGTASAAPSAVGKYAGFTDDQASAVSFDSTARGTIKNLVVVGLTSLCLTTIPGQEQQPADQRTTNITKRETPAIRLRANGRFSATFELPSTNRVDFRGATVEVTGRLRGKKGTVTVGLQMNETYEDGSTEVCSGSVTVPVERSRR
jgi:hypothetical protein